MGLRQGCPPGQASSGGPAGLHPALGPTRGSDPPAPVSCPSAPGVVFGDQTLLAPQVAWVELTAWRRAGFLVLGIGTNVMKFLDMGRRRWELANIPNFYNTINKHKIKAAAPHGRLPHTIHKLKSRPGPLSSSTVVAPPFILPKLLRGTRDR